MKSLRNHLLAFVVAIGLVAGGFLSATVAHADALSNYGENKVMDALLRGQALGAPATMYMGLATDTCTDAGAGTEPSGGAYARVAVTSSLANWAGTQSAGSRYESGRDMPAPLKRLYFLVCVLRVQEALRPTDVKTLGSL